MDDKERRKLTREYKNILLKLNALGHKVDKLKQKGRPVSEINKIYREIDRLNPKADELKEKLGR